MDKNLFWRIFDTFLVFAGLAYIYIKYGRPFFDKRKEEIENSIKKGKEYEIKAREYFEEAKRGLEEAKKEIEFIKIEALKEAETEKENIIKEARDAAEKMRDNFIKQAESEISRQVRTLTLEALDSYFRAAAESLKKELSVEDIEKIGDKFLELQEKSIEGQANK